MLTNSDVLKPFVLFNRNWVSLCKIDTRSPYGVPKMFEKLSAKIQSYMTIMEEYKNEVRISFLSRFLCHISHLILNNHAL